MVRKKNSEEEEEAIFSSIEDVSEKLSKQVEELEGFIKAFKQNRKDPIGLRSVSNDQRGIKYG